ncbi:hypothetical protein P171DRAFT_486769 [Karstenula rhodostoma CBS 690.94]|uniref:Uncharacterized protein n=1 Tax=Karstenula rhodostoma CBS 690.94 TaxID=1392251 RepID=A0A9P4U8X5_9PLEO|nr:hypothetical protein P171DRAFT_486769 [Karstenula rhodostoma CBS 690.94]
MFNGDCPGIKPGPPPGLKDHLTPTGPTPETTRKPTCKPKDYVTATDVISLCVKKVLPVSVAVNSTTSTTISTCSGHTWSMKGCPPIPGLTTTEWQTLTETASCTESSTVYSTFSSCLVGTDSIGSTRTSSCMSTISPIVGCDVTGGATKTVSTTSKPGGCTLAPLVWNEGDGDNTGLPRNVSAMPTGISIPTLEMKPNATGESCSWSPLIIEDDEGDNVGNDTIIIPTLPMKNDTNGGSCSWIPIDLDDAEGDNFSLNDTIIIPTLPMKNDTNNGSCPLSPLLLDDDEGDNFSLNDTIIIPTLPMKNDTNNGSCPLSPLLLDDDEGDNYLNSSISIPLLPMKPTTAQDNALVPKLTHQPITKPVKAPHLSQTAHPTPPQSSNSASPTATPGPKPIPAGGRWEIKIEHAPPRFHWTLYDTGGNEAGGGDAGSPIQCYGRAQKDCFPFDINFSLNFKDVNSKVGFLVLLDLPSGRQLRFTSNHLNDNFPEDGYPSENYGCQDDKRNQSNKGVSRTFWCYFVWHGQGGWDGLTDKVG